MTFESKNLGSLSRQVSGIGNRNKLINGDFSIWQRGNSFSDADGYIADLWHVPSTDTTERALSRIASSPEIANVTPLRYYVKHDPTAQNSSDNRVIQDIEAIWPGVKCTVSMWIYYLVPDNFHFTVKTYAADGVAFTELNSPQIAISQDNVWQRISWTFTMPDNPIGDIINGEYSRLVLNFPNTQNQSFRFGCVQLEEGSVATAFEEVSPQTQLARCQRYYVNATGGREWFLAGPLVTGDTLAASMFLPVPMYDTPTVTATNNFSSTNIVGDPIVLVDSDKSFVLSYTAVSDNQESFAKGSYTAEATTFGVS